MIDMIGRVENLTNLRPSGDRIDLRIPMNMSDCYTVDDRYIDDRHRNRLLTVS